MSENARWCTCAFRDRGVERPHEVDAGESPSGMKPDERKLVESEACLCLLPPSRIKPSTPRSADDGLLPASLVGGLPDE